MADVRPTRQKPMEAELVGGPRDGEVRPITDLRDEWRFPGPVAVPFIAESDDEALMNPTFLVMIYRLALDPDLHRPSINDIGQYRYEFKGYRNI